MPSLPREIIALLYPFSQMFSGPVWNHVQVLLIGTILCHGKRTVTSTLRVMGLQHEKRFEKYHRVLNRAKWSGLQGAKILLGALIAILPPLWPILVGVDETIERRKGRKIKAKGCYRDAVRSTEKNVIKCFGLKWISMMLIVPLPWSSRPWALPFLSVLAPSEKANKKRGKRHKTTVDWTIQMVKVVSRWLDKIWVLIGDGSYACIRLSHACVKSGVILVSRLRLDARLFDFPEEQPPGKRGPKPKKGKRLPSLQSLVNDEEQDWKEAKVRWYGGSYKHIRFLTGVCLWHTQGEIPVPIRWVLVVDPTGEARTEAFFSTCIKLKPKKILEWFILRWNVEVTFEESRGHLGLETQRQWSDKAIARTTPALLGIFSLICLIGYRLKNITELMPKSSAWYIKTEATFSDVLAFVRRNIWAEIYYNNSTFRDDLMIFKKQEWELLLSQLSYGT